MIDFKLYLPFIKSRNNVLQLILYSLLLTVSLSAIVNNGILRYNANMTTVIFSFIVFGYVITISILRMITDPNKFEMIAIPTLLIIIILSTLFIFNPDFTPDDPGQDREPPASEIPTSFSFTGTQANATLGSGGVRPAEPIDQTEDNQNLGWIIYLLLVTALFIFLLRRDKILPEFDITSEVEYSNKLSEQQKEIMQIYVSSSQAIERMKGRAPKWYSPTGYSKKVHEYEINQVSQYFDLLTDLYELARFSGVNIGQAHINEAKDLQLSIFSWIEGNMGVS